MVWAGGQTGSRGGRDVSRGSGLVLSVFSSLVLFFHSSLTCFVSGRRLFLLSARELSSLLLIASDGGLVPASHCGWSLGVSPSLFGSSTLHAHSLISSFSGYNVRAIISLREKKNLRQLNKTWFVVPCYILLR